jgi:cobalt/nickel transport system permease protein
VVVPFVLMIALFLPFFQGGEVAGSCNVGWWRVSISYDGLLVLWNVVVKSWLSALSLILLSATTPFPGLLKGLERLGVPRVMVMILSFMYRYLFVLVDEAMRLQRARESRNLGGGLVWRATTIGNMIGTLFLRSYERGERVYQAMLARGFDGETRTLSELRLRRADLYFGLACSSCLAAIVLAALR